MLGAVVAWKCELQRQVVLQERKVFFDRILKSLTAGPNIADEKFGQDLLLVSASVIEKLVNLNTGILYSTIESTYEGKTGLHSYSLFLTGDMLRIGLLLYGDLSNAVVIDWHNELQSIWPGCPPQQVDRLGLTMYEWTFLLPDLYTSYAVQERYILGMRHMHTRLLRIISDFRLVQTKESVVFSPDSELQAGL